MVGGHIVVLGMRGDTVDEIIRDLVLALASLVSAGCLNDLSQRGD